MPASEKYQTNITQDKCVIGLDTFLSCNLFFTDTWCYILIDAFLQQVKISKVILIIAKLVWYISNGRIDTLKVEVFFLIRSSMFLLCR